MGGRWAQKWPVAEPHQFPQPTYLAGSEKGGREAISGTSQACYVQLWLPGYSLSGTIALVEFRFGPTSHAAITYLLKKQGDAWVVSDYDLSYFM